MKFRDRGLLIVLFAWVLNAGPASGAVEQRRLESGGVERTYRIALPEDLDSKQPVPVLLAFHGGGGQGPSMAALSRFTRLAGQRGWIVVYPDGLQRQWNDGREGRTTQDVEFVADLLRQLESRYPVDRTRIYAVGMSNGGFFSQRLACQMSGKIAAIASVAATFPEALSAICKPDRAVPVMLVLGSEDPVVPYEGGDLIVFRRSRGRLLSAVASAETWKRHAGCGAAPVSELWIDGDPDDGTRIRKQVWGPCREDSVVRLDTVEGGGHGWPGGLQYSPEHRIGKTSRDYDVSEQILDFLEAHRLP